LIAFIGSVFSPYYAWANAKAPAEAENFCAMNMVLYEPRGGYWAMTERKRERLSRSARHLQIGPSGLRWENGVLTAEINEMTVPIPRRLRGRLTFTPSRVHNRQFKLDAAGRHRWQPIAPKGRVEVAFDKPGISWSGQAYFDSNDGDAPLADDFAIWNWGRAEDGDEIYYDVQRRDGTTVNLALQIDEAGVRDVAAPPLRDVAKTGWRVARQVHADAGSEPVILKTLEDAPFYARSIIQTDIGGEAKKMLHESLDLNRFSKRWVKLLLPFRMPRV
jgi:carotenoid 1,2-hydratase